MYRQLLGEEKRSWKAATANAWLGEVRTKMGKYDQALRAFEAALKVGQADAVAAAAAVAAACRPVVPERTTHILARGDLSGVRSRSSTQQPPLEAQ